MCDASPIIQTPTPQTYPLSRSTIKRIFRFYLGYDPKVTTDADTLILDAVDYFLDTLIKETEKACREDGRMLITVNHLQMALRNMGSLALSDELEKIKSSKRADTSSSKAQHKRIVVSLNANSLVSSHLTDFKNKTSSSKDKGSGASRRAPTSGNKTATTSIDTGVQCPISLHNHQVVTATEDECPQMPSSKREPSSENKESDLSHPEQNVESPQVVGGDSGDGYDGPKEPQMDDIQAFESLMNGLL